MNGQRYFQLKHVIALLLCVVIGAGVMSPAVAYAQNHGKKVRVGWYESVFHRTDQFGRRSGYGYEYQQKIAAYTGWEYEYVEASWSELFEMLVAGEIDLLSDVSYTEERAEKLLYSSESMGSEDYHAYIAPDNTEISPEDFSTFNGKRVGVNKNSIQEQLFIEWTRNHGVHPEIVEMSVKSPEMIEMLMRGEIDMLVTLDAYGSSTDMVPVCKTGSSDIFFGINRERPDLKAELDVAMNRILEENRYYNQQLAEKYEDGKGINGFLTSEEMKWLSQHDTIRVGYQKSFLPFCDMDPETRQLTGALADFIETARTIEMNSELRFEAHGYDSVEEELKALTDGEVDCVFPVNMRIFDGEQLGFIISDPVVVTTIYAAVRTADRRGISKEEKMKVAVTQGNINYDIFLMDAFPDWEILYCRDSSEGFMAVSAGRADCLLISNYRLNLMSEMCSRYKLSTLSTGEDVNLSFAVRREDDCLYSILNKVIRLIPSSAVNSSLTNYSFSANRISVREFLRENLVYVVSIVLTTVIVILTLLLHGVKEGKRANEGRQLISETERDRLTNLYNRDYFFVYANRLYNEHPDKPMDAMVLNIDRFHAVNSFNGRDFGDEVLRLLGSEINACASESEGIAGRFEGDRFDIYCAHRDDYQAMLDKFQSKLDESFPNVDIRLRMGVMPWQEGIQPEAMFDLARSACSMIRGNYHTHLMVYDEKLRQQEQFNQRLQNDLGHALEAHEIIVYYQPKYDIRPDTPQLSSAEALIRWNHPELGMIMPSDFIPLFERSGQISILDNYVWKEAARQIAEWRDRYGVTLPMSVNLSRVDVFDPDLMNILDGIVAQFGLEQQDMKLEITESAYTENAEYLIRVIRELREKGYEIEMDDFGTGYSSLNMLSSMPIDVLKMDKEFIRNMEADEKNIQLVELILDIAKNLKVPVIAEGVETKTQLLLLKKLGCAIVQGYYFSRPLPPNEFESKFLSA